jgi:hypothetical protein
MTSNPCTYTRYFYVAAILCEDNTVGVSVMDVVVVVALWCGGNGHGKVRVSAVVVGHGLR